MITSDGADVAAAAAVVVGEEVRSGVGVMASVRDGLAGWEA